MAIFDDIIDSVGKAGKFVADKAIDAKDYVTLEYKVSNLKSDIDREFCELGKLSYELTKAQTADEGQSQKHIDKIDELKFKLKQVNDEMSKFKKTCSACGKSAGGNDAYCKNCGTKL